MKIEDSLQKVQQLIAQMRLTDAERAVDKLLENNPHHVETLFTKAVISRLLEDDDTAYETLEQLHALAPEHGRAFQEKGQFWVKKKSLSNAIEAFEQAVKLDTALLVSWKVLTGLYQMSGDTAKASAATIHVNRLSQLPQALLNISSLINEGRFEKAEPLCRQFLQNDPTNVEAMRLLASIGMHLGVPDDAEMLLEKALEFDPGFHLGRFDYVGVLQKRQKFEAAFKHARYLRESQPDDYNHKRLYANACMNVGRQEEALAIYTDVLRVDPENPQILLMCGHAAKTLGRIDDGIDYYRRCLAAQADYGDAYWSLANLKTYKLSDDELAVAKTQEALNSTSLTDRIHLCFAVGKALEDRGQYADSFAYYARGNSLKLEETGFRSSMVSQEVDRQIDVFDAALVKARAGQGDPSADPIFIVGLPRSGSTLLEQILASHSAIDGTFELPDILGLVTTLNGRRMAGDEARYPGVLKTMNAGDLRELGRAYMESTQIHRGEAPYFVDKMPNNFRHIGLIKSILPNAKIIDARREAMACCFSNFKQLFASGQPYTYGLAELGQYYRDYLRLMAHWERLYPGEILRVQYEDVVEDVETEVRRILDYCELPLEQACIDFHQTDRLVRTPSSEQVRQPIYQHGKQQWKHFESFLRPLEDAL